MAHGSRCYVHLVNSAHFHALTGKLPPTEPISATEYEEAGTRVTALVHPQRLSEVQEFVTR